MFFQNITRHIYMDVAMAPVAAGTGDTQNGLIIDTSNFESIVFLLYVGAISRPAGRPRSRSSTATERRRRHGQRPRADDRRRPITLREARPWPITAAGASMGWLSVELHRPTKRYARITVDPRHRECHAERRHRADGQGLHPAAGPGRDDGQRHSSGDRVAVTYGWRVTGGGWREKTSRPPVRSRHPPRSTLHPERSDPCLPPTAPRRT